MFKIDIKVRKAFWYNSYFTDKIILDYITVVIVQIGIKAKISQLLAIEVTRGIKNLEG